MSERIERIRVALEKMHGAKAVHVSSMPVREVFRGEPVWEGVVEAFDLIGHAKAKRAYAWEVPGPKPDYVGVLEIPPVTSPQTAVKVYVASLDKR